MTLDIDSILWANTWSKRHYVIYGYKWFYSSEYALETAFKGLWHQFSVEASSPQMWRPIVT